MVEYRYKLQIANTNRFVAIVKNLDEAKKIGRIYTKNGYNAVDLFKVKMCVSTGCYGFDGKPLWSESVRYLGTFDGGKYHSDYYGPRTTKVKKKKKADPKNEWPYRFK